MKVYDLVNKLKGTNMTIKEMTYWASFYRISPCAFEDGLELDHEYPRALDNISTIVCVAVESDCDKCLDVFLNSEVDFSSDECPSCGWYAEEGHDTDIYLGASDHRCGNPATGAEYWTERYKCPVCSEVFEIECSN